MPRHRAVRVLQVLLAALPVLAWSASAGAGQPAGSSSPSAAGALRITGTSTMGPLVEAIAQRFRSVRPGVRVVVEPGGSGQGIEDIRAGRVDIATAARAQRIAEQDLVGRPGSRAARSTSSCST